MLKLMKYELQKQKLSKRIIAALFIVLELIFAFGVLTESGKISMIGSVCLFIAAFVAIIYVSVEAIITYDKDMKEKSGYMLFMVPHSEYTILGAKILTSVLTLLVMTICLVLLGAVDIFWLSSQMNGVKETMDMITQIFTQMFNVEMDAAMIVTYIFLALFEWFGLLTSAFLAITIVHTILNQVKGKGFLSFIFFILINMAYSKVSNMIIALFIPDYGQVEVTQSGTEVMVNLTAQAMQTSLAASLITAIVFAGLCLVVSGYMLKKKLSL